MVMPLKDIDDMAAWRKSSENTRCGLDKPLSNPIATTIKNFKHLYDAHVKDVEYASLFDMDSAIVESCEAVGRKPVVHE